MRSVIQWHSRIGGFFMKNALIIVDYQNDFVDGVLGFEKAKTLEAGIIQQAEAVLKDGGHVFFTLDTHGSDYLDTREGKNLPVVHCIKNTPGHKLYGGLLKLMARENCHAVEKSCFGSDMLAAEIKAIVGTPDVITLCGVVTNMCVISNAVLLQTAFENTRIQILAPLCASFDDTLHCAALDVMRGLQMEILE